jgi:hypothetical protein
MKNARMLVLVPVAILAAACGREDTRGDDALKNDLALASQAQPYSPQQFTSPTEMGYVYNPYTGQFQPVPQQQLQAQPAVQRVATRPATTVRRTSSSGTRSTGSAGTTVIRQQPEVIQRNTKRDAVIGAAAGAVIGATVSRDKLKGAVIGAAAGGVLGGIIGHTVDVKRTPGY